MSASYLDLWLLLWLSMPTTHSHLWLVSWYLCQQLALTSGLYLALTNAILVYLQSAILLQTKIGFVSTVLCGSKSWVNSVIMT